MTNERAVIGNNQPPCPFAAHVATIDELLELATGTLTGDIKTQAQFDQVESLLDDIKDAAKELEATRKAEKAPWDAGAKAVQDIAVPLAKKLDAMADSAKASKTPFLAAQKAERDAKEAKAREEAAALLQAAQELRQAAPVADFEASTTADELLEQARIATAVANKVAKTAKGTRTVWGMAMPDPIAAGKWLWANRGDDYFAALYELAKKEVRGVVPGTEWTSREVAT
jgi:hypothetical protein